MDISIIIVTKNRAQTLRECLLRLTPQIKKHDEIIVVDNNSTDATRSVVREFSRLYPVWYKRETRFGASQARNTGFFMAKKEGIAFIDDDSHVTPGWLTHVKRSIAHFSRKKPLVVFQGKMIQRYAHTGPYEALRQNQFYNDSIEHGMHDRKKSYTTVRSLIVANIFGLKEAFSRVEGPFNAKEFPYIGEDFDLSMRLMQKGIELLYVPGAAVIHAKTRIAVMSACMQSFLYGRAKAIHEKHFLHDADLLIRDYIHSMRIVRQNVGFDIKSDPDERGWRRVRIRWYLFWVSQCYKAGYFVYSRMPLSLR